MKYIDLIFSLSELGRDGELVSAIDCLVFLVELLEV
jgi:hypothetical protein